MREIMVLSVATTELWMQLPETFPGWPPGVKGSEQKRKALGHDSLSGI